MGTTRIGRYELVEELARGGMGVVYRGRDPAIGRDVAVKLFVCDERARPGALARFQREARAAGKLRHPGVVPIYDFGIVDQTAYLVMDLIEGETLADRLRRGGPLPPREAARICEAIARTLAFAHDQGVVHRDVKPANVLLRGGQPMLVDFGIAKSEGDPRLSSTGQFLGTPSYMAPEQLSGERDVVGPPADLYALGGTLYELLTGALPYEADNLLSLISARASGPPRPPAARRSGVGDDLSAICLRCLERDPEARYASAELLAQDLASYQAGDEVLANPLGSGQRLLRSLRQRPAVVAAVAAAGAAGLVLLVALAVASRDPATTAPEPAAIASATSTPAPPAAVDTAGAAPSVDVMLEEARALAAEAKPGRAIQRYEAALELLPSDDPRRLDVLQALSDVHLARGRAAREARNFGSAQVDLERALVHTPRSTDALLELAALHQAAGDSSTTRQILDRLLEVDPRHLVARHRRAALRDAAQDYAGAIEDFSGCLEVDPDHAASLHGRAWSSVQLATSPGGTRRQLEGALRDYSRCVELEPQDGLPYQGCGFVHELLGDPAAAIPYYERALELLPADSPHRARAQSFLERARKAAQPR